MDAGLCVPEKPGRDEHHGNGAVSRIRFKEFDRKRDAARFCPLFAEYWKYVTGEDLSEEVESHVLGEVVKMTRAELMLHAYLQEGCKVQMAVDGGEVIGFMLFQDVFGSVIGVRAMYVRPEYWGMKLGPKLVNSLSIPVRRIYFQTLKDRPPVRFLRSTEDRRRVLADYEKLTTWEMSWGDQ